MSQEPLFLGTARAVLVLSSLESQLMLRWPLGRHTGRRRGSQGPRWEVFGRIPVPCMPMSGRFVSSGPSELTPPAPGLDFIQTKRRERILRISKRILLKPGNL